MPETMPSSTVHFLLLSASDFLKYICASNSDFSDTCALWFRYRWMTWSTKHSDDSAPLAMDVCELLVSHLSTLGPAGIREVIWDEVHSAITDKVGTSVLPQPWTVLASPAVLADTGKSAA